MKVFRLFLPLSLMVCLSRTVHAQTDTVVAPPAQEVFEYAEELPVFPGGKAKFEKYVTDNLVYPHKAKRKKIEGTVYISFVVEKDGKVNDVTLIKGVPGLNEAALEVVKNSPDWRPGKVNGEVVRTRMTVPIIFKLKSEKPKKVKKQ